MPVPVFTAGEVLTAANMNRVGSFTTGTGTVSGSTRLNIPSCFSSSFINYRVVISGLTHASAANIRIRFSISGTDTEGSSYFTQRVEMTGGTVTPVSIINDNAIFPSFVNSTAGSFASISFDVFTPNVASPTTVAGIANRIDGTTSLYTVSFSGLQSQSTAFDGISVVGNTGNIACTMKVYGYRD
jgi:hypothetical protein